MFIPRLIHVIWLQGWNKLPEKYKYNIQTLIDNNKEYKIIKWEETGIKKVLKAIGDEYLKKYNSFKTIHQKVDFSRYALLYYYGGISTDVDVVAYKGFDETPELNESDFIVSYNSSNSFENYIKSGHSLVINNATIIVKKNHPVLKGLLDYILTLECKENETNTACINETTGPKGFTEYLNQYKEEITVLNNVYFEPCSGSDLECEIKPTTIIDHRHEGSWQSNFNKDVAKIYYSIKPHGSKIIIAVLLAIILILILK